ncbi:MAG: hypothetical protein RL657_2452 [Pseudomonadota bacterium]|jgi:exodeoxyribonuclease V gamma subunit
MLESMAPPPDTPAHHPAPTADWPIGFMVLHGNRLEDLRQLLIEHVRQFPLPGLSPEWMVVQSNGMKQWLEQGLAAAEGLGVCAATRMVFPAEMLWHAYRTVLGADLVPAQMPLDREHLVWRLMHLLPRWFEQDTQGVFEPLARYVRNDHGRTDDARLLQLCQQLAQLYDGYQNYRADWLRDWARGQACFSDAQGGTHELPPTERWQAQLWLELLADVSANRKGATPMPTSRAEVHEAFLQQMAHATPQGLPRRIVVFGVSAMPMQSIEALAALGRVSQVMVFVLNPCQHHWGHVVSERQWLQAVLRQRQAPKPGTDVPSAGVIDGHVQAQPLLADWGQQGRDYLHLLDVHDHTDRYRHLLGRIDFFADPAPQDPHAAAPLASRLHRLQSDILNLNPLPSDPHRYPVAAGDDSVLLVQAHSAVREVELLHDRILSWLEADKQLRPSDIIVMVPDMTPFAPLIHAVWGRFAADDPRRLPYSVADQSAKDHPMAAIIDALLQGPSARLTLDDWLSWLEVPAFARACGFPPEELFGAREALRSVGVRWGLDGEHRVSMGVGLSAADATPNTWLFGLQRLLLAQAQGSMTAAAWQGVAPADPGDHPAANLSHAALNALCTSLRTLEQVLQQVGAPRTPSDWVRDLHQIVADVLVAQTESEERALLGLTEPLTQWLQSCQVAGLDSEVSLSVVRTHWMSCLSSTGSGNRFLSGGVQFATLMPMRSIPFQRVCLLGMNDGQYPRRQPQTDFDLMRWPGMRRPGDRSRREDDRYLFLEALLCARQQVYISWQGFKATDQSQLYPSVLVGQLIQHLDAAHTEPLGVHTAPMQSFSRQYFERADSPWKTYATDWAHARGWPTPSQPRPAEPPAATQGHPLPLTLPLDSLIAGLRQPLDVFYKHRLGMNLQSPEQELPDTEPFDLNALDMYHLVDQALAHPADHVVMARASGLLPLGHLAERPLLRLNSQVKALNDRLSDLLHNHPWQPLAEQLLNCPTPQTVTDGAVQSVSGTVGGSHWYQNPAGQWLHVVLRPGPLSKNKAFQIHPLLSAWARHVMANACGQPCTTHWIGLGEVKVLQPLPPAQAQAVLHRWLLAYQNAWASPLAVPGRSACLFIARLFSPGKETDTGQRLLKAHADARMAFVGSDQSRREAERTALAMMARHARDYPDVASLIEHWAPVLYQDLIEALLSSAPNRAEGNDD